MGGSGDAVAAAAPGETKAAGPSTCPNKARRAIKVSLKPFQRLAGPGQSPGRSRRSETPQDGYYNGRACVFGTGPAVLLQAVRPRFLTAAFGWGWGLLRFSSLLAGKRKPRPGLGVAAISPKQPAARRRRWRRAHFGQTGPNPVPHPKRPKNSPRRRKNFPPNPCSPGNDSRSAGG